MGHHSEEAPDFDDGNGPPFQARAKLMRELLDATGFKGALGTHPMGKLSNRGPAAWLRPPHSKGSNP